MEEPETGTTIGIMRRMDDLGRITLPMETRKRLKITQDTPLEIFSLKDGFYIRKVEK